MLFSPKETYHFKNKPSKSIKRSGVFKKTINFTIQSSISRISSLQVSQATPNIQFNNSSISNPNFQKWDFLRESKLYSKITNRLNYIINVFDRKRKKTPYKTRKVLKSARFLEKQQYYNSFLNENDLISEFKLQYRKKTRLLIKRRVKQLKSNIALGYKYNDPLGFK